MKSRLIYANFSDEGLIKAFVEGDKAGFDELVYRYKDRVYNLVLKFMYDKSDAEDVTQDVFFELFKNLKSFRYQAKFSTYLYRMVFNTCQKSNRRVKYRQIENIDRPAEPGANAVVRQEEIQAVREALASLPDDLLQPLILVTYEGMNYQDIAGILQLPLGTVKTRIFRARMNLREKLETAK